MKARLLLLIVLCAGAGCASHGSYRRLPAEVTTLDLQSASESYLIELIPAFADPLAKRFDFRIDGSSVSVRIRSFTLAGPKPVIETSGLAATKLLAAFRGFDWRVPDAEPNRKEVIRLVPDETSVIFKSMTPLLSRELQIGLQQSETFEEFVFSLISEKEPNQAPEPTTPSGRGSP